MSESQSNNNSVTPKPKTQLSVNLKIDVEDFQQIKKLAEGVNTSVDDFCSHLVTSALGEIDKTMFISTLTHRYEQQSARKVLCYYKTISQMRFEIRRLQQHLADLRNSINDQDV